MHGEDDDSNNNKLVYTPKSYYLKKANVVKINYKICAYTG